MRCATVVEPTCLLWNGALQTFVDGACRPVNWTASNTTCACGAAAAAAASAGGATMTSGSAAVAGAFASVFGASAVLEARKDRDPIMLVALFAILGVCGLNVAGGMARDRRDNAAGWTTAEAAKARRDLGKERQLGRLRDEAGVAEPAAARDAIAATRTIAAYTARSLPSFVSDRSMCATYGRMVFAEHGWIAGSMFGPCDPRPRGRRDLSRASERLRI